MSAKTLREKYARSFLRMDRYSTYFGWTIVISFVAQIGLSIWIGSLILDGPANSWTIPLLAVLVVFIGTRLRALNNIVHECSHASFVEDRPSNYLIGKFCSALTMGSFVNYQREHLSHHMHLGDYENDLDFQGIEALRLHDPLTWKVILRHLFTPLTFRHLPYYLSIDLSQADGRAFQVFKLLILAGVIALTIIAPLATSLFAIFPFVLVYTALNYWADCIDHAGLVPSDDDLDGSRNVIAPKLISQIFFPRNDSYHLVHHLFPNIPARYLPDAHRLLLQDSSYSKTSNAVGLPMFGGKTAGDVVAPISAKAN